MEGLKNKLLSMFHDKKIMEVKNVLASSKELLKQQIKDSQRTSDSHRI